MRTHQRDEALRRLRRITVLSGVGAGALAAAFAGLAARALPGKPAVAGVRQPSSAQTHTRTATPPPLVPVQAASSASAAAPAAPSAPPAATSAPPVVVSGGS
jgi:hypothetical protein